MDIQIREFFFRNFDVKWTDGKEVEEFIHQREKDAQLRVIDAVRSLSQAGWDCYNDVADESKLDISVENMLKLENTINDRGI